MNKFFSTLLLLIVFTHIQGQSYTSTVDYQKAIRQAVMAEVSFQDKEVSAAIEDSMQKLGYKPKSSKGFSVFKTVLIAAISNEPLDLYFTVDRKSKKEKEISVITMMLSKGGDNFITQGVDPAIIENAKSFLNGFVGSLGAYHLEQEIAAQEELTRSAEKKLNNLTEESDELQKKMRKLEKEISDNKKNLEDQQSTLQKESQQLENLKAQRKQ